MQQPSKATATELFEGRKHYVIPAYQRPYVWNEEDQWAPLWDDIQRVAESHLVASSTPIKSHFLGAVVFELLQAGSAAITELDVIDGQQRLTTLQLLLDAVQDVLNKNGHEEEAERLEELVLNQQAVYRGTPQRFKLWPSQANRAEFIHAMDPAEPDPGEAGQIQGAHDFFSAEAERWIVGLADDDGEVPPGNAAERAEQLAETLASRLVVVAIDLTGDDDAQLIFETLNDRGTPLLKADLIKNWVFRHGQKIGADVDKWSRTLWEDFDTDWWREEITQGRLSRSRVDIFLHYWLTMRMRDEVKAELVFRTFVEYATPLMGTPATAEDFLTELRADADTYRGFGDLDTQTAAGKFRSRIIETMELAATTPVFLWAISPNHRLPDDQIEIGLAALESWIVRRTLLQMTSKDLNKLVVALLKTLSSVEVKQAGAEIRTFLSQQTAHTREWPSDEKFIAEVGSKRLYGYIKQNRIAVVLRAVEEYKRAQDSRYGDVPLPVSMSIEHVMPQKWREHWRPAVQLTHEQEQQRDRAVHTLGNLTLIPQSLNSSLSNRPWTDAEAKDLSHGGQPGRGKWSILNQFNLQVLNKEILQHQQSWTEQDIEDRADELARVIAKIWQGPERSIRDSGEAE
ncbi:DUF262 domain-containing protein [Glutamicibacter sp. BSL13]